MGDMKAIRRELTKERWDEISAKIQNPALTLSARAALRLKLFLEDGSWLLLRASGTEPVLRIYAEADRPEAVQALLEQGGRLAVAGGIPKTA